MSDVHIVIPFGGGDPHRLRIRDWIVDRYQRLHPGWPVTIAECVGDWSKGTAVNGVAAQLDAEVTIVSDADSYVSPQALTEAVDRVGVLGWSMPHSRTHRICEPDTVRILNGEDVPEPAPHIRVGPAMPGGGIVLLDRRARHRLRGVIFDPRFVGWGYEDTTLSTVLGTMLGHYPSKAIRHRLYHLWHPPAPNHNKPSKASRLLFRRYRQARLDQEQMLTIIEEVADARHR